MDRPLDDAELVERAKRGDRRAWETVVRRYQGIAFRTAYLLSGSAADAEEAAQDGFVKAYRALGRFRRGAPLRPWLLRIVVNEARNVRRSELRHARLADRATELRDSVSDELEDREAVTELLAALSRLSQPDRVALALRYFAGLPDRDAASVAGVKEGAHRVRVLRALRRLRAELEERDD